MKQRRKWMLMLMMAVSVTIAATGCDKLKKEPETEVQTEALTEAPTETPTEKETEPPTETETETETEVQTEAPTEPVVLTTEEELAQETTFDQIRMLYAMDDINVRLKPGTDGEIISSFMQGDRVTAVGETPGWYVVELEDYSSSGYVSKQFISDAEVAPKTEEERMQVIEEELAAKETAPEEGTADGEESVQSVSAEASSQMAAADQKFGVEAFAESFPVYAMTGANLRTQPSQDGDILQTIASGSSLKAVGYTDRWYKVEADGVVGYVNKNLFSTEPAE